MSPVHRACALVFLLSFFWVEVAQAGLLRTSGRGSLSRNFSQAFYYIDNSNLNELGIAGDGDGFVFNSTAVPSIVRGVGGGGRGIAAVPNTCIAGYTQDDVDLAIADALFELDSLDFDNDPDGADARAGELNDLLNQLEGSNPFPGEPCVWEFEEGESLFTYGFFSLFFDTPDVTYDVSWRIFGNGLNEFFAGSINEGEALPTDDPAVTIERGWVTLDTLPPATLVPGDYMVSVSVGLRSQTGAFFWESSDPNDPVGLRRVCTDNFDEVDAFFSDEDNLDEFGEPLPDLEVPPSEICGFNSVDLDSYNSEFDFELRSTPTFFQSEAEMLRIVAASVDPDDNSPNPVPAPSTLATLLAGLAILIRRRRLAQGA